VFLLGSNYNDIERKKKEDLCRELKHVRKFSGTFLMEQIFDEEQHKYMDEAFNKFIHDSDIIVALLTKDGSKDGVGWKIGFMQGVDFLSEKFKIRKRLFLCLEGNTDSEPELTSMIKKWIIKKEGCRTIRFTDMTELSDILEGQLHAELIDKLEKEYS